jgi:hypothetical protein
MEGEMETKSFFTLQVKCPSRMTDLKQTCAVHRACTWIVRTRSKNVVSRFRKIRRMEGEIQSNRYFVLQVKFPSLLIVFIHNENVL